MPTAPKTSPGYMTSEFWVSLLTCIYILYNGESPDKEMIAGSIAAVYAMVRGFVKSRG